MSEPPPPSCDETITGTGWIDGTPSGKRANFGIKAGNQGGKFYGDLTYVDHGQRLQVRSSTVTSFIAAGGGLRFVEFWIPAEGRNLIARVWVGSDLGAQKSDHFEIQLLSNGAEYYDAAGDLDEGNIQVEKRNCP